MKEEKRPVETLRKGVHKINRFAKRQVGVGRYMHLGMTYALGTLLFLYFGYQADKWLGTLPIFTIVGTFVGGVGGFLYIYKELTAGEHEEPEE